VLLPDRFRAQLRELYDAAAHNRPDEVLGHLHTLVPEYAPTPRLGADCGAEVWSGFPGPALVQAGPGAPVDDPIDVVRAPALAGIYPDDY